MKVRKVFVICLTALLVAVTGCGKNKSAVPTSSGVGSSEESSSSIVSETPSSSIPAPSESSGAVSSAGEVSSKKSSSENTSPTLNVSSKKPQNNSKWVAYTTNKDSYKLHIKREDGSEDKIIVNDTVLAPCVAGEWVYYIAPLDKINKVKLDGSQKTKACDTDSIQVYNTENKDYHGLNGSTFITAEYTDGYILYEFIQGQQPGDDFSKPNPPSYYKLDPKTDKITKVKRK